MLLFAVAHGVKLRDGMYAVRCPEFPGCDRKNSNPQVAREQFNEGVLNRVLEMIGAGEAPPLYCYDELEVFYPARCKVQTSAPDRLPGTFDIVMIVPVKLQDEQAKRLMGIRAALESKRSTMAAVGHSSFETAGAAFETTNDANPSEARTITEEAIDDLIVKREAKDLNTSEPEIHSSDNSVNWDAKRDDHEGADVRARPGSLDPSVRLAMVARRLSR
jgi:hypothetical protein